MQFTTDVVQVVVELVSDSSEQWSLIKIQIFGLNSSEPISTNTI